MVDFGLAHPGDAEAALGVWRAANIARGRPPGPRRIARIREKLAEPDRLLVVGREDGTVVAMALAEPGLAADGQGPPVEGLELARAAREVGWNSLVVWTGADNARAHRLYEGCGFAATGRVGHKGGFANLLFDVEL